MSGERCWFCGAIRLDDKWDCWRCEAPPKPDKRKDARARGPAVKTEERAGRILRIWHKVKHDDFTVTERPTFAPRSDVETMRNYGGFWSVDAFIPWHSISYIEVREAAPGASQ